MKNKLLLLSVISLTAFACERRDEATFRTADTSTNVPNETMTQDFPSDNTGRNVPNRNETMAQDYPSDNTGKNVRDRDTQALTPMNQFENAADRTITQNLRKAIVAEPNLSMNAKNIKIITRNGVVTLRGPVANEQEIALILQKAKSLDGINTVNNQLEIAGNN